MSYNSEVLADAPLLYYRLGEASGTVAADAGSAALNGTYNGTVTYGAAGALSGDPNTAVTFAAVGGFVSVASDVRHQNPGNHWTVEAWIFPTSAPATDCGVFAHVFTTGQPLPFVIWQHITTGNIFVAYYTGTTWHYCDGVGTGTAIPLNAWTHIVGTYDGTTLSCYINGVLATSSAQAGWLPATTVALQIAKRWDTTAIFQGSIDEVALYTTTLSAARILTHYNAGLRQGGSSDIHAFRHRHGGG